MYEHTHTHTHSVHIVESLYIIRFVEWFKEKCFMILDRNRNLIILRHKIA